MRLDLLGDADDHGRFAALVGAVAMVLTGCVPTHKVYESIDWSVICALSFSRNSASS